MKKQTMIEFPGGGGVLYPRSCKGFFKIYIVGAVHVVLGRFIFFKQLASSLSFRKQISQELLREETE